jgi:hypothetical protein
MEFSQPSFLPQQQMESEDSSQTKDRTNKFKPLDKEIKGRERLNSLPNHKDRGRE